MATVTISSRENWTEIPNGTATHARGSESITRYMPPGQGPRPATSSVRWAKRGSAEEDHSFDYNPWEEHNVTLAQYLMATHPRADKQLEITEAQRNAIIAANEAPVRRDDQHAEVLLENNGTSYQIVYYEKERKRMDQINRVLLANLSLPEIYDVFHFADQPITVTDDTVDRAMIRHYSRTKSMAPVNCGKDVTNCNESMMRWGGIQGCLVAHNVSQGQIGTAIIPIPPYQIDLSDAQVDAIVAADGAPVRLDPYAGVTSTFKVLDYPKERKHLDQINRALLANLTLTEIYTLFHAEDGQPIYLTDEEVDAAL